MLGEFFVLFCFSVSREEKSLLRAQHYKKVLVLKFNLLPKL